MRYVRVIAAGTCEATGGAVLGADDVITFPLLDAAQVDGGWRLDFGGEVRFAAHHGALDVTLAGLRLDLGPDAGALSITAGDRRLTIAELAPAERDDTLRRQALPASLTEAGIPVFGNVYPAGTDLAPFDVDVAIDS
ncbi:hypothetical protein Apa02nite_066650 [Actinoplanes palleronii]|uniref:Htaa domain-containing protein n=2 Tax=Actinoplanes palleronii TaxID=113570 RepID=A0ABQ4BIX7_9ACTN|nr:hypothetical protein Apa02nite_066650 [Actinoplanes palleronii]